MTTKTLPIACSLSRDELPKRLAEMAAIGRSALIGTDRAPARATLRFKSDDGTRTRLTEVVAAEAQCCAFLALELRDEGGALVLEIAAPADAEPVLDDLVAAFSAAEVTA